jgi:hypothetical protein
MQLCTYGCIYGHAGLVVYMARFCPLTRGHPSYKARFCPPHQILIDAALYIIIWLYKARFCPLTRGHPSPDFNRCSSVHIWLYKARFCPLTRGHPSPDFNRSLLDAALYIYCCIWPGFVPSPEATPLTRPGFVLIRF